MKIAILLTSLLLLLGCKEDQVEQLQKENSQLKSQLEAAQKELVQLKQGDQFLYEQGLNYYNKANEDISTLERIPVLESSVAKFRELKQKHPQSPLNEKAETYLKRVEHVLGLNRKIAAFDDATENRDIEKAGSILKELKASDIDKETIKIFERQLAEAKDRPIILSHEELHKLSATGMKVGQSYKVQSYLSKSGQRLMKPLQFDKEYNMGVRFTHDFEAGSEEMTRLYDLRGKEGCFTLYMATGEVWLKSFKEGNCN